MSNYGGGPSCVNKQNEAILMAETSKTISELEKVKKERNELREELEKTKAALRKCKKRLGE